MKCYLVLFLLCLVSIQSARDALNPNIEIKENPKRSLTCSESCSECATGVCKKCERSKYLFEGNCYDYCPGETLADNFSMTCKNANEDPVYTKAYTLGSCINKCGKQFSDCSCSRDCMKNGNCCSDYKYCIFVREYIQYKNQCVTPHCKSCSPDGQTCLMCEAKLFLYRNNCYNKCPVNTRTLESNALCLDPPKNCSVENCEECVGNSNTRCKKCQHGFFLHNSECFKSCPKGLRANRVDFTCVEESTFALFMIFPSKHSCKNKCGGEEFESDCSCHHYCLKDGNCCDDFEKECQAEMKNEKCLSCTDCVDGKCLRCVENSHMVGDSCVCDPGTKYDIISDKCLKSEIHKHYESNQSSNNGVFVNTITNPYSKGKLESLLFDSFKFGGKPLAAASKSTGEGLDLANSNVYFNGNVTLNILNGNDHPSIVNEHIFNENSHNNTTKVERNENSKNLAIKGAPDGTDLKSLEEYDGLFPEWRKDKNKKSEGGNKNLKNELEKRKIVIDKHFHMDNAHHYPQNLSHEEGVPATTSKKEEKLLNNDSSSVRTKKIASSTPQENEKTTQVKEKFLKLSDNKYKIKGDISKTKLVLGSANKNNEKLIAKIEENKKKSEAINVNPKNEKDIEDKMIVNNHYYINDKSVTVNQPKTPSVINFYEADCKEGDCKRVEVNGETVKTDGVNFIHRQDENTDI